MTSRALWSHGPCIFILCLAAAFLREALGDSLPSQHSESPAVCIVIRTYWGHGDLHGDKSLRKLFWALKAQTFTRWEALLLVMDDRPFPELRRIVRDADDDRIWVHAELINVRYSPKTQNTRGLTVWNPGYHNKLYTLTDSAIRACPPSTEWVLVTNGDNNYDSRYLEEIINTPSDMDAITFDFYSRYQRPTVTPCERFATLPELPKCKENEMRFCQTDLSANVYRWRKMVAEDRRFGTVGSSEMSDGVLAEALMRAGWKINHVRRCLVDHGPSPQQCAMSGGVWDDTRMAVEDSFGGRCINYKQASKMVGDDPTNLEMIKVGVTYDPYTFDFSKLDGRPLVMSCVRQRDSSQWVQAHVFGQACVAPVDRQPVVSRAPEGRRLDRNFDPRAAIPRNFHQEL